MDGFAISTGHFTIGGRGLSASPMPSASAVPLIIQYGTSAPICTPLSISCLFVSPSEKSLFTPISIAAASVLPPAIPAATGIRLSSFTDTPSVIENSSIRSFAALYMRLFSFTGRKDRLVCICMPGSFVLLISSLSYR